ncbi:MAG: AAA family ATPase [Planctomycetota bacterium]|nr:AAA family ATPase [Planctomycetota bacterium]
MQLRKLELQGFKSFADETVFAFDPGLTALVGPNGCGKSNIVDAVKWVLGEMSPKSLRGDELLDVIFNGSETRTPTGCAEVSLTFSNEDGRLPIEYAEVTVTRRLFKSGESEYLLNRQPCRLKDIKELFMDTGVGTDFYSVIEQGRIDTILQSNPKDRRSLFDEAAGISKYRAKKRESESKLERVTQDLMRIMDVTKELDSEIRSLKIQATKAEKFKRLTAELRKKRAQRALRAYHDLHRKKADMSALVSKLEQERESFSTQLSTAKKDLDIAEEAVRLAEEAVRTCESGCTAITNELEMTGRAIEAARERLAELSAALVAKEAERDEIRNRIAELERRQGEIGVELAEAEKSSRELADKVAELERLLTQYADACREVAHETERKKSEIIDVLRKRAGYQNELTTISIERKNLYGRKERNESRAGMIGSELSEVEGSLRSLQEEVAGLDSAIAQSKTALNNEDGRIAELNAHSGRLAARIAAARESLGKANARKEALEDSERELQGIEAASREVMRKARALLTSPPACHAPTVVGASPAPVDAGAPTQVHGDVAAASQQDQPRADAAPADRILGLLAELLEVEPACVPAVDRALGDMSHAIVTSDTEAADAVARLAEAEGAGDIIVMDLSAFPAATEAGPAPLANPFEPLTVGNAIPADAFPAETQDPPVRVSPAPLVDFVCVAPPLQPLLRSLLADYGLVEGRDEAADLIVRGLPAMHGIAPDRCERIARLVTSRGEGAWGPGIFCTAPSANAQPSILSRKVELRELAATIDRDATNLEAIETEEHIIRRETAAAEANAQEFRHSVYDNTMLSVQKKKDVESAEKRRTALQSELEVIRIEVGEIDAQTGMLTDKESSIVRVVGELDMLQRTVEEEVEALAAKERELERRRTEAAGTVNELRVRLAEATQRVTFLNREGKSCEDNLTDARTGLDRARISIEQLQAKQTETQTDIAGKTSTVESLKSESESLGKRLTALKTESREKSAVLRSALESEKTVENALADRESRLHQARMDFNEHRLRLEGLEERVREELGVELEQLAAEEEARRAAAAAGPSAEAPTASPLAQGDSGGCFSPTDAALPAVQPGQPQPVAGAPAQQPEPEPDPAVLEAEIEEIRRKLEAIPNVNLSAVDQLKEVELRASFLKTQQDDLVKTKAQLEELIRKINRECRDMFLTTLGAIRENFNTVFRKLFGGGKVDVVLEENVDPLDSGIEIMAKPPGKELTSISLLSGGEKSLTTVALVMGIFMLKPCPFCILDEADAALDESNIDRYAALVKEFAEKTQFVLITHNKRTMAMANIIYGVTMQEPGVSRKISVRFVEEATALLDAPAAVPATA